MTLIISEMKNRIFTILMAVILLFSGCGDDNTGIQDPVKPGETDIPEIPADTQVENTSFHHRIMLLQHTGTYCPNCPKLMSSLKEVAEDKAYSDKYHHVAAHSYNQDGEGDAAYSTAAANLSQAFCSGYYPELTFNLTTLSTGTSIEASAIRSKIDQLHKDSADAGIAASTKISDGYLNVAVETKVAKENLYRIAVWLLEDDIESDQDGATEDWQHIHDNAVRAMAGETLNLRIYGSKTRTLLPGEKADKAFSIKLEDGWNPDNCKVLILVNAADRDGRYDLVNCAICPIDGSITYDYK